jgi:hypothetical protein
VIAEGSALHIEVDGKKIPLEHLGGNSFLADEYSWRRYPLVFGRSSGKVVELSHGSDWYVNANYTGPKTFATPPQYEAFAGHYRSDSPWFRSTRVVVRKGKLWLGGASPLDPIGEGLFRMGGDSFSPDVVEFLQMANGKTQLLKTNGSDHWRVDIP